MDCYARARELIDAAHAGDSARSGDGRPAELVYADRVEAWVMRLVPDAPSRLRLAARCQHLERWTVARSSYPAGRTGYLAWRKALYRKQADRARELLLRAEVPAAAADEAAIWVSKAGMGSNQGTQTLEDAACLVFLENELAAFAAKHAEFPTEKLRGILNKTWRKMSPRARELARQLKFPEAVADLVHEITDSV